MTKDDFQIINFDPNMATEATLVKYLDWREEIDKETNPNDSLLDRAAMLQQIQNRDSNYDYFSWLIISKQFEKVIGFSTVLITSLVSPNYDKAKHVSFFFITILSDFRRLGLGTQQLRTCLAEIQKHKEISLIQTSTRNVSGKQFCEKYGGTLAMEGFDNRLYLDAVDWGLVNTWVIKGEELAMKDNIKLETFEEIPEEYLIEYCNVLNETARTGPQIGLEGGGTAKPDSYRDSMKRLRDLGHKFLISITLEKNGQLSGLTTISIRKETPMIAFQGMTGVLPEFRGRGLGKWLKADMLQKIREKYPEIKYIRTGNANNNDPMLSINNRLGFKVHEHVMAYKFELKELLTQFGMSD